MGDPRDDKTIRCRRLGHEVPLGYCRTQEGKSVCPLVRDCWWEFLDIDAYLRQHLDDEEFAALQRERPPRSRLAKMIELAVAAKGDKQKQ